ncbi:hypothetical protein BDW59DRAFT_175865 [Aspergillus cavernicola]|uniref:Zn(2)-C6 fungal-type domain-containing protein n=1 Tax=Aspergillus cavernicola TaxID=176166 RepID=A0ABR4HLM6_9EURO
MSPDPTLPPQTETQKEKDKPSKPRPISSCSPCRIRKVKCNRLTPCTSCIARKSPAECTYATTTEDREAIAAAELIAELRATRNELRERLSSGAGAGFGFGLKHLGGEYGGEDERGNEEKKEVLEGLYAVIRGGEWGVAREVVGRVRAGEGGREVLEGVGGL